MYLKKLELIGFKSFPEKSQFIFNRGITCIVGPNGCGKSNLLDALRWVLGEQKTSLLRGTKMEEVIFAGTRSLKPLGMAEVSLHVSNNDGVLPSQYNELTISRRLFRSGDSEYMINKVPCRLKDITDMFADTGMGTQAYAIIQQDMIDAILSDKTEERRMMFEEAAGITKYKQRKKAAERKLDATTQDLLRLQDILSEVNTRVNSLKRQVGKAKKYKVVSEELKQWELYNARSTYDELTQKRTELSVAMKKFDDSRIELDSRLNARSADLESMRETQSDLDRSLADLSNRIYELSEKAHQVETDISVDREKRDNLHHSIAQNREEIDALQKRNVVIREEQHKSRENLVRLEGEVAKAISDLEQAITVQKSADAEYLRFRNEAENESAKLSNIEGQLSTGKSDSANIDEQIDEIKDEIDVNNVRKRNLTDEKANRRNEIANLQVRIDTMNNSVAASEERIEIMEKELDAENSRSDRLRDQLSELSSSYEATLARKNLLAEMIERHEGFGSGVVAVFDIADRWVDITGTVADFVRPKDGYQRAIEVTLGESAQYIVCSRRSTAREAIAHLREQKAGQATFLILEKLKNFNNPVIKPMLDGVINWASELVECEERYRLVPSTLLGRTLVCESADAAQMALEHLPEGYRTVSLGGDMFSTDGILSGGASEETSLVGRKNEVEMLQARLEEYNRQITSIRQKQSQTALHIAELRQKIEKSEQALDDEKEKATELTTRLKEEQFKINAADEVLTSIDRQIDSLSQKLEKLKHRQYSLALDFDQLDREKVMLAADVETRKAHLAYLEQTADEAGDKVNKLQVAKVELESERSHHASQIEYYDDMLDDIAQSVRQKQEYITQAEASVTQLELKIENNESALKEIFEERRRESAKQQELRQQRDGMSGQVSSLEVEIKKLRKERESIGEETHQTQITLTEIKSRIEQIEDRIRAEYEDNIAEIEAPSPDPEKTREEAREHVEYLRDRLRRMGIVNLLALEEYNEQKERQEFLSRQLDDLISAKATLKSTIQKINNTARQMFLETLQQARANFQQMYTELFTGGEADVMLEDESDPLESRIEIISRPRGKKPLTIAQLSGGERALTAISLMFALYMVKPSPFCFLDEIDAPLDDINVGRFLKIVRKFSRQTQFIIITHNKITMEAADTLYGVTMEEPGVSKVVSVKFKKDGDEEQKNGTILELHYARDDAAQAG